MNILILDKDPIIAAQMLCDKHVVKMPLETAQLLCSVFWVSLNNQISLSQIPYKLTHHNHPCSIWSRQSQANFSWLVDYGIAICKEYSFRYNKIHKSEKVIHWCNDNQSRLVFKELQLLFKQCLSNIKKKVQKKHIEHITYKKNVILLNGKEVEMWFKDI
ncbi:MAG: pyrimidine dimer DNA glycosylase/endonuclease V [Wolbachia endosymbiont of Xenopsylla cheopis]